MQPPLQSRQVGIELRGSRIGLGCILLIPQTPVDITQQEPESDKVRSQVKRVLVTCQGCLGVISACG